MLTFFMDGFCGAGSTAGVNQLGRAMCSTTDLAGVTILVHGGTFGAGATDVSIGQRHFAIFAISLFNVSFYD